MKYPNMESEIYFDFESGFDYYECPRCEHAYDCEEVNEANPVCMKCDVSVIGKYLMVEDPS